MKKAIWITIGVLFFLFCVYTCFKPMLPEKVDPNKYLANDKGYAIKDPNGGYYLPYTGAPGETQEETDDSSGEKTYYVSGVWMWNAVLEEYEDAQDGAVTVAKLKFKTAQHEQTSLIYEKGKMATTLYYSDTDIGCAYIYGYGWMDPTTRLIDCGTEPQQVSQEFYLFLTQNAKPATKDDYIGVIVDYVDSFEEFTLSGYWVWNKNICLSEDMNRIDFDINGTCCNGNTFYGFTFRYNSGYKRMTLYYMSEPDKPGNHAIWFGDGTGWSNDKERYIYLGEQEQTVTANVYNFFVSNAHPCTKEEFDAMAVKDASETSRETRNYFEGTYQWTNTPFAEYIVTCGDRWEEHDLNVQSNGKTFTSLYGIYDAETELYEVYYGNEQEQIMVFSSETGWTDEAFKTIVFSERAYVYMETYTYFSRQLHRVETNN